MSKITRRIVINADYGMFNLSDKGYQRLRELLGDEADQIIDFNDHMQDHIASFTVKEKREEERYSQEKYHLTRNIKRDDPRLVQVVEEMGREAGRSLRIAVLRVDWDARDGDESHAQCRARFYVEDQP